MLRGFYFFPPTVRGIQANLRARGQFPSSVQSKVINAGTRGKQAIWSQTKMVNGLHKMDSPSHGGDVTTCGVDYRKTAMPMVFSTIDGNAPSYVKKK